MWSYRCADLRENKNDRTEQTPEVSIGITGDYGKTLSFRGVSTRTFPMAPLNIQYSNHASWVMMNEEVTTLPPSHDQLDCTRRYVAPSESCELTEV
jgi:hypothetical protein